MDKTYDSMEDGELGEVRPDNIPDFKLEAYESYQQFKSDYMESEVLIFLRERQKRKAKIEWDVYLDREREVIEVKLGAEITLFQGENILSYEVQDPELVGIQLKDVGAATQSFALVGTGKEAGATILRVRFATQGDTYYILSIIDPENPTTRYLGSWTAWTYYWAGNWIHMGKNKGRGRQDQYSKGLSTIKDIYVYILDANFERGWPDDKDGKMQDTDSRKEARKEGPC